MISQQDLVAMCKNGDPYAYTKLYEHNAKYVYNAICRYVEHTGEAEDIMQEAFVDAYHAIAKLTNADSFRPWIKRIAINKAINWLRKKRLELTELEPETTVIVDEIVDEEEFEFNMNRISQAIEELPLAYRTIFQLYAVENIPQVEIAQMLGMSNSTVRVQYFRAKAKVLEMLKEGHYER
ncbi:RNA polymerase sigma factor [Mucilaginibacter aquatilis]|uniref:Sigma-70 family RNA polymerase sigma factor n=1 Tax=Mucilaginibacter aquatilis TaxID=1517760 RepID=A0A6I4IRD0_9SPHI|nr:RNA polymerase sigma factor [Mucilaginibacter aquatilis]MVN92654.1 sigma-70 family RNA polymerase sigma factor [Mucilaginibacter aquatilis]